MINEFKKFILRGNLVDLVIGFTVGASFSALAKSLVDDILMPPIGLVLGASSFANKFIVLKSGIPDSPYQTADAALAAGAVIVKYGAFLNNLLSLVIVGLAMFVIIKGMNRLEGQLDEFTGVKKKKGEAPSNKKCPYCLTTIAYKAVRCPACTSDLRAKIVKA